MTQGTPASSQIIWLEGRVAELESQMQGLSNEINDFQNTIERQKREIHELQCQQDTPLAFYDISHDEDGEVEYEFSVYPRPGFKPLYTQAIAQAAQPAHTRAIDTSPERVEEQAGNVKVPEGWKLVPVEPIEAMWSMLARDIVFWLYSTRSPHYGSELHTFLRNCGTPIPNWLAKEIPDVDHTPPKGTVAVCIYKAMLSAAPSTKEDV